MSKSTILFTIPFSNNKAETENVTCEIEFHYYEFLFNINENEFQTQRKYVWYKYANKFDAA